MATALKVITAKLRNRLFTTSEVGAMLGLSTTEVNNLIDEIVWLGVARAGEGVRTVEYRGLLAMLVAKELIQCQLKPELRRQTLAQALSSRAKRVPVPGTNLELLVGSNLKQINHGLRLLYEAEAAVQCNSEVMQGEPCIRSTRIPVYMIANLASAVGVEETLATYPNLTERQVTLAQRFVLACPRKGPPRRISVPTGGRVVEEKIIKRAKARRSGSHN